MLQSPGLKQLKVSSLPICDTPCRRVRCSATCTRSLLHRIDGPILVGGSGGTCSEPELSTLQTMAPNSFFSSGHTERFDDHLHLKSEDWIATVPLNKSSPNAKELPPVDATADEIYQAGARLSQLRESIPVPNDGVYCPVCHIANTQLAKLRTPCPKCSRPLLKFGWD